MFIEYIYVVIAALIAFFIGILIFIISYSLVQRMVDLEKISIYECGFEPFEDTRGVFDVKFYLVSILFLIFDLEVLYLFPWIVVIGFVGYFSFFSMYLFLLVLGSVFVYEWLLGALDF